MVSANKLTLNVKNTKFMMLTGKNLYIGTNKLKIGNQIIEPFTNKIT